MMNLVLQATALADTLAGGNPVLTPLASGEPQMNLWEMAMKGGWIMAVLALLSVVCFYIFFDAWLLFARLERTILCSWNVSATISVPEK